MLMADPAGRYHLLERGRGADFRLYTQRRDRWTNPPEIILTEDERASGLLERELTNAPWPMGRLESRCWLRRKDGEDHLYGRRDSRPARRRRREPRGFGKVLQNATERRCRRRSPQRAPPTPCGESNQRSETGAGKRTILAPGIWISPPGEYLDLSNSNLTHLGVSPAVVIHERRFPQAAPSRRCRRRAGRLSCAPSLTEKRDYRRQNIASFSPSGEICWISAQACLVYNSAGAIRFA